MNQSCLFVDVTTDLILQRVALFMPVVERPEKKLLGVRMRARRTVHCCAAAAAAAADAAADSLTKNPPMFDCMF